MQSIVVFNLNDQSETELQEYFINLLANNGYEYVEISNYDNLVDNFKTQLKSFNNCLSFDYNILDYLCEDDGVSKFDKLRNSYHGIDFIDFSDFSSNIFQVTKEVQIKGEYINRYDVTILVNGLPLIQIELKKSGVDLNLAFNQIQRYDNQSLHGLFEFVQVFAISNKVHTRYFFNDSNYDYNSTYVWKDSKDLESFAKSFLTPKNLISFLNDYIIKNPFSNDYMMIRPYQADIINKVLNQVENRENAYIWMSYNTGKTITSLRLADILKDKYTVVYLTRNHLSKFDNVVYTYKQFLNAVDNQNLIITNINKIPQKEEDLDLIRDKPFIFILNEYEKDNIKYFPEKLMKNFKNSLFYCFTSAPIFDENISLGRTTKFIFDNQLATYSFKDALRDKTNLNLDVEYIGDEDISDDYDLSSDLRINKLSCEILKNYPNKTKENHFKSILIADSNNDLIRYYQNLKDELNVAPFLRFDSNDIFDDVPVRDYFEKFIFEYNNSFNANVHHRKVVDISKISEEFEKDIIERFKNGEIDLVLIDKSMFKDKFHLNILGNLKNDSINTIYLDCKLNYGQLFEALTMVNMVGESQKIQGNIVLFRNLQDNILKTIRLFSNENSNENYQLKDYGHYLTKYSESLSKIKNSTHFTIDYGQLSKYYNILQSFDEFNFNQTQIDEFNLYKDKYNHEILTKKDSKKVIQNYEPKLINHFIIDLNYINSLNEEKSNSQTTHNVENNPMKEININHNENNYSQQFNINQENKYSKKLNIVNNHQDFSKTINVKNEYHIHIGGDSIPERNNIEDLNGLIIDTHVKTDDLSKICPVCHKKYSEEYNYCSEHEDLIDLIYVKNLIKVCRECGAEYPKDYNYCRYCDCDDTLLIDVGKIKTNPNRFYNFYNYPNSYSQINELLTSHNIEKLFNFNLSQKQFEDIINTIKGTDKQILEKLIDEFNINMEDLTPLEKVLLFSKSFVKTDFKEGGGDFGHFEFNEIYIDDRATNALQITTIIHELSHFLLAEILEQIISLLLDTNKTDAVEAFILFIS